MKECIMRVASRKAVARLPELFIEVATLVSIFTLILLSLDGTSISRLKLAYTALLGLLKFFPLDGTSSSA